MEEMRKKLCFDNYFTVDPMGRTGGITLILKFKVNLEINNSLQHISGWITDLNKLTMWLLMSFYGHPEAYKRKESWALLDRLNPNNST